MEMLTRSEAEKTIKDSIEDYLSIDMIQEIINTITDNEDFLVIEDDDIPESEDDD